VKLNDFKGNIKMTFLRLTITSFVLFLTSCGGGGADSSTANTTSPVQNNSPKIESIANIAVGEQAEVIVNATATDSDGTISTYIWQQTAGATVEFEGDNTNLSFLSPITIEELTLTFELTVTDNDGATASKSVDIIVTPINSPPTVTIPNDFDAASGQNIILDGTNSSDDDGSIGLFDWSQIDNGSVSVSLIDAESSLMNFDSPKVEEVTQFEFSLKVIDNEGAITEDSIIVTVYPILEGKFISAPNNGLSYVGKLTSGDIDDTGLFTYTSADLISPILFSIGGVHVGSANGSSTLSVMELVPDAISTDDYRVNDINRFLMSIDDDCNLENGIAISPTVIDNANSVEFSFNDNLKGLESENELSSFVDNITCADDWVSASYAQVNFEQALAKEYEEELSSIAVFTLEGEIEPSIVFDSTGTLIQVLDGDDSIDELYRVLYSVDDEVISISFDLDGLPSAIYMIDGSVVLFNNFTTESVDVLINSTQDDGSESQAIERVAIPQSSVTALLKIRSLAEPITALSTKSMKRINISGRRMFPSSDQAEEESLTQIISDKIIVAASGIKVIKDVVDTTVDIQLGSKLDLLKGAGKGVIERVVWNSSLKELGLTIDEQNIANMALSGLKCTTDVSVYSKLNDCLDVVIGTAKNFAELHSIYNEGEEDKKRIAGLIAALEKQALQHGQYPPVVNIDASSKGKKYTKGINFTLSAYVKDANEEIPLNNMVWYWNGTEIDRGQSITYQHPIDGEYSVKFIATDSTGRSNVDVTSIKIGNKKPVVTITQPSKRTYLCSESPLLFTGKATDLEDGEISSEKFSWSTTTNRGATIETTIDKSVSISFHCPPESSDNGEEEHYVILKVTDSINQEGSSFKHITISNSDDGSDDDGSDDDGSGDDGSDDDGSGGDGSDDDGSDDDGSGDDGSDDDGSGGDGSGGDGSGDNSRPTYEAITRVEHSSGYFSIIQQTAKQNDDGTWAIVPQGSYQNFHGEGYLYSEGTNVAKKTSDGYWIGVIEGLSKFYNEDGTLHSEINYVAKQFSDGYWHQVSEGLQKSYSPGGVLYSEKTSVAMENSDGSWVGIASGIGRFYHSNGNIYLLKPYVVRKNSSNGTWSTFIEGLIQQFNSDGTTQYEINQVTKQNSDGSWESLKEGVKTKFFSDGDRVEDTYGTEQTNDGNWVSLRKGLRTVYRDEIIALESTYGTKQINGGWVSLLEGVSREYGSSGSWLDQAALSQWKFYVAKQNSDGGWISLVEVETNYNQDGTINYEVRYELVQNSDGEWVRVRI
jgi:hypothetical protein